MKKFEIKDAGENKWMVSHHEIPKFTCLFEDKRFSHQRTITGLSDPTGNPTEVQLLLKMEQWLKRYHKDKTDL